MLKILRNIRRTLLSENKLSRYVLYATGEIVLVVIGILIALGINNFNEERKNRLIEYDLLIDLKNEFQENQKKLLLHVQYHSDVLALIKELNEYIEPSPREISDEKLDSLMYGLGWLPAYKPSERVLNSIISSGNISLIRNKDLSALLSSSFAPLNNYEKQLEWNEKQFFELILPYIQDKFPLGRTLPLFDSTLLTRSKFSYSKEKLLSDMGFESLVSNRIIDASGTLKDAKELFEYQEEILRLIDNELER